MTMQSYLESGTAGTLSNRVWSGDLGPDALSHGVRDGLRLARFVVVADERAPAVGHEPVVAVDPHLEAEPQRRALQLARPDVGADHVAEEGRRPVGDVALGEDEAELAPLRRRVLGRELQHVVDPRGLEEAQELDVVHVLHRVEVAEAHPLDGGEARHRCGLCGIWMRAIDLTSFQNRTPETTITATAIATDFTFSAVVSSSAKMTITSPSRASMPSTAQYLACHIPYAHTAMISVGPATPWSVGFWPL